MQDSSYVAEGAQIVVMYNDSTSVYDTKANKCSCVASSHGQTCLCSLLVCMIERPDLASSEEDATLIEQPVPTKPLVPVPQMLAELSTWASSSNYEELPGLANLVRNAHTKVFSSFKAKSKKRKITVLHPYRKEIVKNQQEHNYNSEGKKKKGIKRKTPNDFHTKTSSTLVKKSRRAKGISELYRKGVK